MVERDIVKADDCKSILCPLQSYTIVFWLNDWLLHLTGSSMPKSCDFPVEVGLAALESGPTSGVPNW